MGIDLGLFTALAGGQKSMTVTILAENCSAAPKLLGT